MSLARTACLQLARPRTMAATSITHSLQIRQLSHDSHSHDDHHGEHQDTTQYPKEGLSSVLRNSIIVSVLLVGFYKFAPTASEDVSLTRWLAKYNTPVEIWEQINLKHLYLSKENSDNALLVADAKRPTTHRYRYPQALESFSPHCTPVGGIADMRGVVVKGDRD